MKRFINLSIFMLFLAVCACDVSQEEKEQDEVSAYPIRPVDIQNVRVTDDFWLPIIKRVQQKTIEYALQKCAEEGRFENFLIAGGKMEGRVRGAMPFDDSDVYKIIEGASNSLISITDPQLETLLDSLVEIIRIGQEPDGYITTWRTINPARPPAKWVEVKEGRRWESLAMSHELYNAGHMYEAAAVHYIATGKRNFLDIALKNADLMVRTFGDGKDKIQNVPGHQIIETGLIKLYQITGKEDYLKLAKYFLDHRGDAENHKLHGAYAQDHIPVVAQDEVVGHAVRAVYMYAAMTDIAAVYKDSTYRGVVDKLWENMVHKKMYITGGIGARHEGEAFGENYELPNLTAYSETCAAIGSVYWNHRLFNLTGNVKYMDVLERTLYNGLISGISLDGTKFFYPNALESDGKYTFNQGACTRKDWFDCSCCPTNLIRFIPAVPGLIYAKEKDTIYVNLHVSSTAQIDLGGKNIRIEQQSGLPWSGDVKLKVEPETGGKFVLKIRIPGWVRNEVVPGNLYRYQDSLASSVVVTINGEPMEGNLADGYLSISRSWKPGDEVSISFPMQVRQVFANEKVKADSGKVALEYGPLVYAVEEVDNKKNFSKVSVNPETAFVVRKQNDLLGGVNVIDWETGTEQHRAVPYYVWSNRGVGKMKVWIDKMK